MSDDAKRIAELEQQNYQLTTQLSCMRVAHNAAFESLKNAAYHPMLETAIEKRIKSETEGFCHIINNKVKELAVGFEELQYLYEKIDNFSISLDGLEARISTMEDAYQIKLVAKLKKKNVQNRMGKVTK